MQKLIGCILIVAASSGIGYLKGVELKRHLTEVEKLRQIFLMLKSEIQYTRSPLPDAFRHIGNRMEDAYGAWLKELSCRLEEKSGTTFLGLWEETIDARLTGLALKGSDLERLKAMGMNMGYLDEQMQTGTIGLYLEQLELQIGQMREELGEKRRLCNCLGVMGGIFLAVILI